MAFLLIGCTETRVKRYGNILDPLVGTARKTQVNRKLGIPAFCQLESPLERCEYRTARGRNEQIPYIHQKREGFPDLSPYEHFDVLHLYYDGFGILRDWEPVVMIQ